MIHFISYPKSGRSWIRFALDQLNAGDNIKFHHDEFEFNDGNCPQHDFRVDYRLNKYKDADKIVYLERDPRDVMCSLFHQVTGRFRDFFNYQGNISEFIRHPYFGAKNLASFRAMWTLIEGERDVFRISYEQMSADPEGTLSNLLEYLGCSVSSERLRGAIEISSFSSMKKIEKSGEYSQNWLKLRNNKPKVRNGVVGGYLTELSPSDIDYLNTTFDIMVTK